MRTDAQVYSPPTCQVHTHTRENHTSARIEKNIRRDGDGEEEGAAVDAEPTHSAIREQHHGLTVIVVIHRTFAAGWASASSSSGLVLSQLRRDGSNNGISSH